MTYSRKNIITLPNAALRSVSKKVSKVDESIKKVIQQMQEAALDWEDHRQHEISVALAAIQINKPLQIVVVRNNFDNKDDRNFYVLINPKIIKLEGEILEDYEGCLSVSETYGLVPRHEKIRLKALNIEGKEIRLKAEGFLARVLQHEIDHTQGVVFIDHIKDKPEAFFRLNEEGKLEALDYQKDIKSNKNLWQTK